MMATLDGSPFLGYLGTARVGDIDQPLVGVGSAPATLSGTVFLDYRADTGDVVLGAATTPGAAAPDVIGSFSGIQNQWDGDGLLASFFLRSDQPPLVSSWQGGQANVTLSNFRVRSGAATAIPEPGAALLGGLVSGGLALRRLPRRRTVRRSTGLARRRG
jgi:hypothetical protein